MRMFCLEISCNAKVQKELRKAKKVGRKTKIGYLSVKNAFSVRPVQAVAAAMTNVVIPNVEWMGTRAALNEAVADSQHKSNKKLKNPTMN